MLWDSVTENNFLAVDYQHNISDFGLPLQERFVLKSHKDP